MINREEFGELIDANNELNKRMKVIHQEKSKWRQTIFRLKQLSEQFQRQAELVRLLGKKGLI